MFVTLVTLKGAWHENFEKLILLKLPDNVSFHLNISATMKKLQTCISIRSNKRKMCLCYLLFIFSVVTTFSNFQATFPLISPKVFGIFTLNCTTKVWKILLNFWYQNHSGFEKNWGDDVVDHVRHFSHMGLKFHTQQDKSCIYHVSRIALLCYTILNISLICYTILFFFFLRHSIQLNAHGDFLELRISYSTIGTDKSCITW